MKVAYVIETDDRVITIYNDDYQASALLEKYGGTMTIKYIVEEDER